MPLDLRRCLLPQRNRELAQPLLLLLLRLGAAEEEPFLEPGLPAFQKRAGQIPQLRRGNVGIVEQRIDLFANVLALRLRQLLQPLQLFAVARDFRLQLRRRFGAAHFLQQPLLRFLERIRIFLYMLLGDMAGGAIQAVA
ncbi:hypothetical protein CM49_06418 [Paenibacillus sp. P1XP2]|nr:hypothetical protein CM49_06418 [Paenibacillus sp. P1XP2]